MLKSFLASHLLIRAYVSHAFHLNSFPPFINVSSNFSCGGTLINCLRWETAWLVDDSGKDYSSPVVLNVEGFAQRNEKKKLSRGDEWVHVQASSGCDFVCHASCFKP